MRVFVTGASGWVGSAVVPELIGAGHEVVGLARSDASAEALTAAGAEVQRGSLDDVEVLRAAADASDGVIHLAFKHDLMGAGDFAGAAAADFAAIKALAGPLEATGKPFVISSGTLMLALSGITGRPATEADAVSGGMRVDAENYVIGLAERGVRSSAIRLPPIVHSSLDHHGFAHILIAIARQSGVSGYVDDGANRWPSVHTLDAARVYRLALESAPAGSRLHAVADEGIPFRHTVRYHDPERPGLMLVENRDDEYLPARADALMTSVYFDDPDGIHLELNAWLPEFRSWPNDAEPMSDHDFAQV